MAKIDYKYGDKSPPPDFLCILWILLFEQEKKLFILLISGRQICLIFFFLALSLVSEYDLRKDISFAAKFPYL